MKTINKTIQTVKKQLKYKTNKRPLTKLYKLIKNISQNYANHQKH